MSHRDLVPVILLTTGTIAALTVIATFLTGTAR